MIESAAPIGVRDQSIGLHWQTDAHRRMKPPNPTESGRRHHMSPYAYMMYRAFLLAAYLLLSFMAGGVMHSCGSASS
eukprot:1160658-Pelagomonas_calceolata.AAC.8